MAWNYRYPTWDPTKYTSYEEYEEDVEAYERAEDDYIDECMERYYEEKYAA